MNKRIRLYASNEYSNGAKELAKGLGIKRIKHQNSKFRSRDTDVIINWGATEWPNYLENGVILNAPPFVSQAVNKLNFLSLMKSYQISCVPYTVEKTEAEKWLKEGEVVIGRKLLRASGGDGIEVYEPKTSVGQAPLYTKYIKKHDEYRVHLGHNRKGEIKLIDFQKKVRKNDVPDDQVNWKIRNLENGFIYQRNNITLPSQIFDLAVAAHEVSNLNFGAYDIIHNRHYNQSYLLEVNTAPGLVETTLQNYTNYFKELTE